MLEILYDTSEEGPVLADDSKSLSNFDFPDDLGRILGKGN